MSDLLGFPFLNGRDGPPERFEYQAGPLTIVWEPEILFLRQIRLGDHEIARAIYPAVRDGSWRTIAPSQVEWEHEPSANGFRLTFRARAASSSVDYQWKGVIEGLESGAITYRVRGEALNDFERMRIGLCYLHPFQECVSKPVTIHQSSGDEDESHFPESIAPHEPFSDIRSMTWDVAPGVPVRAEFDGEVFETEDQRNWSDASFKTYSTPAALPRPVRVSQGDVVEQSIKISFPEPPRKILPILIGRDPQFNISTTPVYTLPPIGLTAASHDVALEERQRAQLKALPLSHLRVHLNLENPQWRTRLAKGAQDALTLGVQIHLALYLSETEILDGNAIAEVLSKEARNRVAVILVYRLETRHTSAESLERARQTLSKPFPKALFATGSRDNFVEVNRHRKLAATGALPSYAITPAVHAFDELTVAENISAQRQTTETLAGFWPQAPVISPISIPRNRYPIDADAPGRKTRDDGVDPRQGSLFNAGWTIASIGALATGTPPHSLTFGETSGPRGILPVEDPSVPLQSKVPYVPGGVYPVYHALADLQGAVKVLATHSSHPWITNALTVLLPDKSRRILVANHSGGAQTIRIKTGPCEGQVRIINRENLYRALSEPESFRAEPGESTKAASGKIRIELGPYAFARIDIPK